MTSEKLKTKHKTKNKTCPLIRCSDAHQVPTVFPFVMKIETLYIITVSLKEGEEAE